MDPIQDGNNWYVYCNNNPLCFVDPTGLADVHEDHSVTFDDESDELKDWADNANYDGWEDSLKNGVFYNLDGENVTDYVRSLYNDDGAWIGGKDDTLIGITLISKDVKDSSDYINMYLRRHQHQEDYYKEMERYDTLISKLDTIISAGIDISYGSIFLDGALLVGLKEPKAAVYCGAEGLGSMGFGFAKLIVGIAGSKESNNYINQEINPLNELLFLPGAPTNTINKIEEIITGKKE